MHALLHRGGHDLRRREPDALVDDLEADVAGPHGDLLGAVGVPVEAGLADQHPQPRADLLAGRPHPLAHRGDLGRRPRRRPTAADTPVGARNSPNTSRSAPAHSPVVTPALAQAIEASIRLASVLAASRSASSARLDGGGVPAGPPGPDRLDRGGLDGRVDGLDRRGALGLQRAGLGGLEPVDPDDDVLAGLDPPPPLGQRRAPAGPSCSRTRRRRPRRPSPAPGRSRRGRPRPARRPWPRRRGCRRRGPRTPAGRSRRPAPAASAAPTAGPTAAAGRAPRSRPGSWIGAGPGVAGQRHREHLQHDALHVVLRLRLGQPERVDLHAVAQPALLRVRDAVALAGDLVPQPGRTRASCTSPRRTAARR